MDRCCRDDHDPVRNAVAARAAERHPGGARVSSLEPRAVSRCLPDTAHGRWCRRSAPSAVLSLTLVCLQCQRSRFLDRLLAPAAVPARRRGTRGTCGSSWRMAAAAAADTRGSIRLLAREGGDARPRQHVPLTTGSGNHGSQFATRRRVFAPMCSQRSAAAAQRRNPASSKQREAP